MEYPNLPANREATHNAALSPNKSQHDTEHAKGSGSPSIKLDGFDINITQDLSNNTSVMTDKSRQADQQHTDTCPTLPECLHTESRDVGEHVGSYTG